MFDESIYPNLTELNLTANYFMSLKGFGYCPKLRVLTVSANKLDSLFCKPDERGYPRGLLGLPVFYTNYYVYIYNRIWKY